MLPPMSTTPNLSSRVASLKPSVTVAFTNRAKQMRSEGIDVLGFAAGEPDFDTPQVIREAAKAALDRGMTRYQPTLGPMEVREAIALKLREENGLQGVTGSHVAIGAGGKHVLYTAMHSLLSNKGPTDEPDEVLLPVPAWVSYRPIAELAGATVTELETSPEGDFKITPDQLRDAIKPRTAMLVLNSPSNPCGTMYTEAELRALAEVIDKSENRRMIVLTDEIYEKIVYGGIPHFSIGSVPEIADRVLTLNGLSKAYAMTGWRIGYAAMPGDFGATLIKAMGTLQGQMTTNITAFCYPAIPVALRECAGDVAMMVEAFGKRAALVEQRLAELPGVKCPKPTGAFYAFPDISGTFGMTTAGGKTLGSSLEFCEALLQEAHVAFVPGEDFGGCGGDHARISFACSEDQINKGMDRVKAFFEKLG